VENEIPKLFFFLLLLRFWGSISFSVCVIGGHYQWRAPPSKKKTHGRLLCVCVCVSGALKNKYSLFFQQKEYKKMCVSVGSFFFIGRLVNVSSVDQSIHGRLVTHATLLVSMSVV
jgi:hypothetical protein